MGMYSELLIKCDVIRSKDPKTEEILKFLFSGEVDMDDQPKDLPDHKFFRCERWFMIGRCSSCYHIPSALSFYDGTYLFSRSDLKDYDNEIYLFLDWLYPSIDEEDDRILGWYWYEESENPTMITRSSILKYNLTNRKNML